MARSMSILRVLAELDPRLWELVHPNVPVLRAGLGAARQFGDEVALNPQPLPPRERLLLETVSTAQAVADAAITAQFAGRDAREVLQQVADDWCGTQPSVIPWPRHWPHPWPPGAAVPDRRGDRSGRAGGPGRRRGGLRVLREGHPGRGAVGRVRRA